MKNLLLSFVFLIPFSFASAEDKGKEFEGKYLFAHSVDSKVKEYSDVISTCFLLNATALKVLQTYESCVKLGGRNVPLEKAIGECSRKDKASVYFFETKQDCESARKEMADGAAT